MIGICSGITLYVWRLKKSLAVYKKCLSLHSMYSNQFWALSTKEIITWKEIISPFSSVRNLTMISINIKQENDENNFQNQIFNNFGNIDAR